MAMPSSGAISFAQMQTEFGGSNPIGFNEYYAGGSHVPSGTGSIPSSGTINLSTFYGTQSTPTSFSTSITAGTSGFGLTSYYGYYTGNALVSGFGSISNSSVAIQGLTATIEGAYSTNDKAGNNFHLQLSGGHAKNVISSVTVTETSGSTQTFVLNNALIHYNGGTMTTWQWQQGFYHTASGTLTLNT